MMHTISLQELKNTTGVHLLDVRPGPAFEAGALPGAVNNCVFEVVFLTRMPCAWSTEEAIVLIGQSDESLEALMAAEKLERAGYADIRILAGGMDATDYSVPSEVPPVLDGDYPLDAEGSTLQWTGRNLLNSHSGSLGFSKGRLSFTQGALMGGQMTVDWDRLVCDDLAGTDLHDVLVHHLKDHDFFDVDAFPAPSISITSARPIAGGTPGAPSLEISAELTMKGVTRPVTFQASAGVTGEGSFALNGNLSFDRTEWGVIYGSGKFFRNLGMHLVNDRIELGVQLATQSK